MANPIRGGDRRDVSKDVGALRQLGIDRMTVIERIALAREILDSVAAKQSRAPLFEARQKELDRWLADLKANPSDGVPGEEVEAAALARFAP